MTLLCMQSEEDAARIKDIGAKPERVVVTGNLKFDQKIPPIQSSPISIKSDRPVITAGSTHRGEETILLEIFHRLRKRYSRCGRIKRLSNKAWTGVKALRVL